MLSVHYFGQIFMNLKFSQQIARNVQVPNFMQSSPVGRQFLYADRRTDRQTDRHVEAFRNFANALIIAMTKYFLLGKLKNFPLLN